MATIIGSTSNQYIDTKIEWTYTQSVSNNTSTITATLYYTRNNTGYTTYGTWSGSITINGTKTSSSKSLTITNGSWVKAMSATVTVPHSSDGTKSITISAAGSISGTSLSSTSVSSTVSLKTIPRASSITSAGNVTLGNACSVKWTPLSSGFAYKLKFVSGSVSYTTGYISPGSTSAYTYSGYTMTVAKWAAAMPKAYSATCTVTLYTYSSSSSSSSIGSDSTTFTLKLSSSVKPTATLATPTLVDGWNGYYIQGKSKCTLSATFEAGEGSTISSCSLSGTGLSKTGAGTSLSGTTSTLTKSGSITYTAKVTDGRTTVSATKSIYVYPYAIPTVSLSASRTTKSGYVKITYKAGCSSINSKNSLSTLKIYKKLSTDSSWPSSTIQTVSLSSTSASGSVTLSGFDSASSYDIKAVVTDVYGSSSKDMVVAIASEFRILNIKSDKTGLSIGKMSEESIFDCALPARFLDVIEFGDNIQGKLYVDQNTSGANIVYLMSGQTTSAGAEAGLAVHNSSVYVPSESNSGIVNLGSSGRKWNQLYAASGTIETSDRNVKTDIEDMSDVQEQLFNQLKPVTYKLISGTSDRTHYGFISQDVEDALISIGLTGQDFAGFCKDARIDDNDKVVLDENGDIVYDYSLRYSEFIALNTYMIQKLQAENIELKAELQELKEMITASSNNKE